jgi:signal transduction histidine kinase
LGAEPITEVDATLEAWAEALKADAKAEKLLHDLRAVHLELKERSQQAVLMRHVANILTATARVEQLGSLILDVMQSEFGARQGLVWALCEDHYGARHGMGFDRQRLEKLHLPAPHPFPHYPILIYQSQWLEAESLPPALRLIQGGAEEGLFFVPFEHQTLLVGFTILSLPRTRVFSDAEQESLEVLQRLFAASLHGAWTLQDLQRQRESFRAEAEALKVRNRWLDQQNQGLRQGLTFRVDFLAYAAGALRNQLLGVLALLSRVRQDRNLSEEERGSLLLDGLLTGKHMAELLRDLSELANPTRSEATALIRPTDLVALFKSLQPIVEAFVPPGGEALRWPEELDLPEVLADEEGLKQILLSLCTGALRGSKDGSLHLWIEREPMSITLRLMVEGLDLGEATASFNSCRSLSPDELYVKGQGGAGLGLVICRQLMVAMGGAFKLERDPMGSGTVIGLELPLA